MARNAVSIGELRDHLSAFLRDVRRGREVIVLDRETPIARIIAYEVSRDLRSDLASLVAEGLVRAPETTAVRPRRKRGATKVRGNALLEALLADREDGR